MSDFALEIYAHVIRSDDSSRSTEKKVDSGVFLSHLHENIADVRAERKKEKQWN